MIKVASLALMIFGFGLAGCTDSDECRFVTNCSGGGGYTCTDLGDGCYTTRQQCQDSATCN